MGVITPGTVYVADQATGQVFQAPTSSPGSSSNIRTQAQSRVYGCQVEFRPSATQRFGFDHDGNNIIKPDAYFTRDRGGNHIPWKSIDAGNTDVVNIIPTGLCSRDSLRVIRESGIITPVRPGQNNMLELLITGGMAGEEEMLTVARASTVHVNDSVTDEMLTEAGSLGLVTYNRKIKEVVLVPVNQAGFPSANTNTSSISKRLNEIYSSAVVNWQVRVDDAIEVGRINEEDFKVEGTAMLSKYTSDMNKVIRTYKRNRPADDNTMYLFFVDIPSLASNRKGFMPLAGNYGFIFNFETRDLDLLAHELAHGAFNLRHTFSDKAQHYLPQNQTRNLMDYADGVELWKYQWDLIHNPEKILFAWSQDEEEGAYYSSGDHYIEIEGELHEIYNREALGASSIDFLKEMVVYYFPTEEVFKVKLRGGVLNRSGEIRYSQRSKWKYYEGEEIELIDNEFIELDLSSQEVILKLWCDYSSRNNLPSFVRFVPLMPQVFYNSTPESSDKIDLRIDPIDRERTIERINPLELKIRGVDFYYYERNPRAHFSDFADALSFIRKVEWNGENIEFDNSWVEYPFTKDENSLTIVPKLGSPITYTITKEQSCLPPTHVKFRKGGSIDYDYGIDYNCTVSPADPNCAILNGESKQYPSFSTPMGQGVPWVFIGEKEEKTVSLTFDGHNTCRDIVLTGNGKAQLSDNDFLNIQLLGNQYPRTGNYFVEARSTPESEVVGKLNVVAVKPIPSYTFNVQIVLVKHPTEDDYPTYRKSWNDIEAEVNKIFSPLGVNINMNIGNVQRISLDYNLNQDDKLDRTCRVSTSSIHNSINRKSNTYYLFIIGKDIVGEESRIINGYAIRNLNFPRIGEHPFATVTTKSTNQDITIAHELGHSIFGLRDVREEFGVVLDPFNIMNYGRYNGAKLKAYQVLFLIEKLYYFNNLQQWTEE
ncbi:hypothetical protein [Alkalitalea saponilacus]|uniref:Uncharacterized protein n=1 Tax=Alkalitalea saponilacus TaxID=889453 RepID=A0A1T5F4X0_9BACT|nr:hypothetical protein [Alkalitalea saponilacus]ASB50173.1 hypothetical protein CDL62_14005 [Alkalitalea saponilacus]SKB91252.1 hypothetical protein SAMN03080601_01480 [Alkalitalea saponilacus]